MRKIACQPKLPISTPPSDGPSAVPTADIVPSSPIARPARSFGTDSPTSAIVNAIIMAAPKPWPARATISTHSEGAAAQASEATVNGAIPSSISRRRPNRSPSRPATRPGS